MLPFRISLGGPILDTWKTKRKGENKMNIEIKSRYDDTKILFCGEYESLKHALEQAAREKTDLSGANLYRADLSGANLSGAYLYRADLYRADLSRANLSEANLYRADLSRANLSEANLYRADLSRANLSEAKNILFVGPIGSRGDITYIVRHDDALCVKCGCFWGTMDEFAVRVEAEHGDNEHGIAYRAVIEFVKAYAAAYWPKA
jgi:hypothetical protein